MSTMDLRSDAAFDTLLAHVREGGLSTSKTAKEVADEVRAGGGDAADAGHKLMMSGFAGQPHWINALAALGLSSFNPRDRKPAPEPAKKKAAPPAPAAVVPVKPAPSAIAPIGAALSPGGMSSKLPSAPSPAAAAVASTAGWAAEYRASAALQREYASERSYVAAKRFDARKAGAFFVESAAVDAAKAADDPHGAEWHQSAALQAEFITPESYAAVKRAEARGSVSVHRGSVTK